VKVTAEGINFSTGLADDDAWAGRADVYLYLSLVLLDRDLGETSMRKTVRDVLADLVVLFEVIGEMLLVEPRGFPIVDVANAHCLWMNLLSHALLLGSQDDGQVARPLADLCGAAHCTWAEALEGRSLVGSDGNDPEISNIKAVVVLCIGYC
jgi:hypothetical protein